MPRRINDYPIVFTGWHSLSSLGHGLVLLSLFVFFIIIAESKYSARKLCWSSKLSTGVPFVANRHSFYTLLIIQLRLFKTTTRGPTEDLTQLHLVFVLFL
jgi:heme/copper-type cytochrome/quinol oxidase subunit 1